MSRGPDRVYGELAGWILKCHGEDGVDPRVGVFDLHIEVGEGVPKGTFSWIVTLYSGLLNVGGSSLTSRIVMVRSAVVLVLSSSPEIVVFTNSSSLAACPGRG